MAQHLLYGDLSVGKLPLVDTANVLKTLADSAGWLHNDGLGNFSYSTPGGGSIALTSAHILVGNALNVATDVAMSGDATISNTGALTLASGVVTPAKLANASAQYKYLVSGATPFAYAESGGFLNITSAKTLAVQNSLTLAGLSDGLTLTAQVSGYAIVRSSGSSPNPQIVADPTGGNARGPYSVDLLLNRQYPTDVASGSHAVIIGGYSCEASGDYACVVGAAGIGIGNPAKASGISSAVIGGQGHLASGQFATVVGGDSNTASGTRSTAIGGRSNVADGTQSIAMGTRAHTAGYTGAIIFSDSTNADFNGISSNEFAIRATGGFRHAYDNSNYWTAQVSSAGAITLSATGASAGFEFDSAVSIKDPSSSIKATFVTSTLATSNKTFTFPNNSGTFMLVGDAPTAHTILSHSDAPADATGWLHKASGGVWAISTPSYSDVGADASGAAATVQGNLNTHTALTTTAHGGASYSWLPVASAQYHIPVSGATPFAYSESGFLIDGTAGGKTSLSVTSGKTLTLTATDNRSVTFPILASNTDAITTSSDVSGATSAILASSSGLLTLKGLTTKGATLGVFGASSNGDNSAAPNRYVWLVSTGDSATANLTATITATFAALSVWREGMIKIYACQENAYGYNVGGGSEATYCYRILSGNVVTSITQVSSNSSALAPTIAVASSSNLVLTITANYNDTHVPGDSPTHEILLMVEILSPVAVTFS